MASKLLLSTPVLARAQLALVARTTAVPAQFANYVTASAVVMAGGKAKKASAPARAKGQSNSFRKKKIEDDDLTEGATGGAGRLNEKYYKPAVPVKVEEFIPSMATKEHIGQVLRLPAAFTPVLNQSSFPTLLDEQFKLIKPSALVVRDTTVAVLEKVDKAMKTPSANCRIVLTGEAGSGKSATLLQTVSHCHSAGWVVIYVPRASTWVNSSYAYSKISNSNSFVQPLLASNLAGQIMNANYSALNKMVISEDATVGRHEIEKGTTLKALLETGVKDQFSAQEVMEVFMKELGAQKEIPTLIAVDEVNSFFRPTQYLNKDAKELDPERLMLPKLFLNYISGKSSFSHGAVVTATSETYWPNKSEVLDVSLGTKEVSPYKNLPENIVTWTQGLTRISVPNYTKSEAKGVFDYYKKGNVFYDAPSEALFFNKFMTSGGNPRKFFTACAKGI